MKQVVLTLAAASLVGMIAAQNSTSFNRNFYGCTSTGFTYCQNGFCYNSTSSPSTNTSFVCSKSFNNDAADLRYPVTQGFDFSGTPFPITQLEHVNVVTSNPNGVITLKQGTTARWIFLSKAEKSAFIELDYVNPTQVDTSKGKQVKMFVFNNRKENYKIFDMTAANKVLLPQSQDNFTVYLVAQGGDFDITLRASNALKGLLVGLVAVLGSALAFAF